MNHNTQDYNLIAPESSMEINTKDTKIMEFRRKGPGNTGTPVYHKTNCFEI
jgi:hypothetical protein